MPTLKRITPAILAKIPTFPVGTLVDVMKWAFKQHHSRSLKSPLNLDDLLDWYDTSPSDAIVQLQVAMGKRLTKRNKEILREALRKRKNRNARIHSRKVLEFMVHLFLRKSKIPPPWVT